jgi:antitoxin (DNA-binding transcriptional repressor) of toxin-antitoxin stability system
MKATISLKQLRIDPREYVRLLNSGFEVSITEHRRTIARAVQPKPTSLRTGNINEILRVINSLPPIKVLDPELDTVSAIKKSKTGHLEKKYSGA